MQRTVRSRSPVTRGGPFVTSQVVKESRVRAASGPEIDCLLYRISFDRFEFRAFVEILIK